MRFDVGLGCRLAQLERLDFVDHDIRRLRSDALVEAGFHIVPLPLEETQLGALVAGKEFLHVESEVRLRRECHAEGLDFAVVVRLHLVKRVRYLAAGDALLFRADVFDGIRDGDAGSVLLDAPLLGRSLDIEIVDLRWLARFRLRGVLLRDAKEFAPHYLPLLELLVDSPYFCLCSRICWHLVLTPNVTLLVLALLLWNVRFWECVVFSDSFSLRLLKWCSRFAVARMLGPLLLSLLSLLSLLAALAALVALVALAACVGEKLVGFLIDKCVGVD